MGALQSWDSNLEPWVQEASALLSGVSMVSGTAF